MEIQVDIRMKPCLHCMLYLEDHIDLSSQHGQKCQKVKDMDATEEKIHLKLDQGHQINSTLNSNTILVVDDGLVLNICYYVSNGKCVLR